MNNNNDSRNRKNSREGGTPKKLKIATCIVGIFAILIFIATFVLTGTNDYTNIFDKAPAIYLLLLLLTLALPAVWVILFVRYRKAKNNAKIAEMAEAERREAKSNGEIYCTPMQAAQIGNIFNDRIENCPVCGTAIEYSSDYVLHAQVQVRKKLDGVYVSRNYSADVEQAYETVSELKSFPNAQRYYCPNCKWEAYRGRYETYGFYETYNGDDYYCDHRNITGYYTKFNKGNLYRKIKLPQDEIGGVSGTFERK